MVFHGHSQSHFVEMENDEMFSVSTSINGAHSFLESEGSLVGPFSFYLGVVQHRQSNKSKCKMLNSSSFTVQSTVDFSDFPQMKESQRTNDMSMGSQSKMDFSADSESSDDALQLLFLTCQILKSEIFPSKPYCISI